MMYTKEVKAQIEFWSKQGKTSRQIAEILGIGKSGVNNYLNSIGGGPKVLFFDLETTPDVSAHFGRWNVNIGQANVLQEGGWLLSAAWSWLGQDTVHSALITPANARKSNDTKVAEAMLDAYNRADIVVAHNGKSFDVPVLKGRALVNGLMPPRNVRVIDTLQMAKKFRFASNKLDSLVNTLSLGEKVKHSGIQLWIDCMQGDKDALDKMQEYNIKDVALLKELYYELAPFDTSTPNFATYYNDEIPRCRTCGSTELRTTGAKSYTNLGKFSEVVCGHCGTRHRTRVNELSKGKRKSLTGV